MCHRLSQSAVGRLLTEKTSHVNLNAINGIRSSKLAPDPAKALELYRVAYSTKSLSLITNVVLSASTLNNQSNVTAAHTKNVRLIWVPAPIVESALPGMAMAYRQRRQSRASKNKIGDMQGLPQSVGSLFLDCSPWNKLTLVVFNSFLMQTRSLIKRGPPLIASNCHNLTP